MGWKHIWILKIRFKQANNTICWLCYLILLLAASVIDQNTKKCVDDVEVTENQPSVYDGEEQLYIEVVPEWLWMTQTNNGVGLGNSRKLAPGVWDFERYPGDLFYIKHRIQP